MKSLSSMFFSILAITALLTPALADEAPPPSQQAKAVEALVIKAAAVVEQDGKTAAFAKFREKDGEWFHGDTYLYAYDASAKERTSPVRRTPKAKRFRMTS
jgi:cytochrome c